METVGNRGHMQTILDLFRQLWTYVDNGHATIKRRDIHIIAFIYFKQLDQGYKLKNYEKWESYGYKLQQQFGD